MCEQLYLKKVDRQDIDTMNAQKCTPCGFVSRPLKTVTLARVSKRKYQYVTKCRSRDKGYVM